MQRTPVFLPGESQGQRRLGDYSPQGRKESDTTGATQHTPTVVSQIPQGLRLLLPFLSPFFGLASILKFTLWLQYSHCNSSHQASQVAQGKESSQQCKEMWRGRFSPWVGKIPWSRQWQRTPVLFPGKFQGQKSLLGFSPWGCKDLDTTEQLSRHTAQLQPSHQHFRGRRD